MIMFLALNLILVYATLDKSVRSPIGPVVPGMYMLTTEGSPLVPEMAAERNDASCLFL